MTRSLGTLLAITLVVGACGDALKPRARGGAVSQPTATSQPASTQPKVETKGLKRGNARLARVVERVMSSCKIHPWLGTVSACSPVSVAAELQQTEIAVGVDQALLTYCYGIGQRFHRLLRPLSRHRLAYLGHPLKARKASESTLRCLINRLEPTAETIDQATLGRVTGYVASHLGKEDDLFEKIGRWANRQPLIGAHNALWPNGRLRVLPRLTKLLQSKDPKDRELRLAMIKGTSRLPPTNDEERAKLCAVLAPPMGSTQLELETASAAAFRISRSCPAHRAQLLPAAVAQAAKGRFDETLVGALAEWGLPEAYKWSEAQRKQVVALLTKVTNGRRFLAKVRGAALRSVHGMDPVLGTQLAKRHSRAGTPPLLLQAAKLVLEGRTPKKAPAAAPKAPAAAPKAPAAAPKAPAAAPKATATQPPTKNK